MSTTNRPLPKIGGKGRSRPLSQNRRASLLVAAISAIAAAGLIYAFVSQYHTSVPKQTPVIAKVTVLVAKQYIPEGTPLTQVSALGLAQPESVPTTQAVAGALADTSAVAGQVVSTAIPAGQQLTAADFSTTAKPALDTFIAGDYRAVAFPLDAAHGLTSYVAAGQRVDVMGKNGNTSRLLAQNVEVIDNLSGVVVLRLTDKQGLELTAAAGKYALWLSLRPAHGAKQSIRLGDQETL